MNLPTPAPRTLDDMDCRIIVLLRAEPRMPNTEIAAELGIAEPTVASRIRSLETDGVIRISAQRDFRAAGYEILASVDLGVRGRSVADISKDVAAVDGVAVITMVMGERPLMLLVIARSLKELHDIVAKQLASIEGVVSVETMVISDVVKYRSEFAALSPLPKTP